MQRFYRPLFTMCIAMLCIFFVPSKVQAANYTPAQVTGLKATAGESQVSLKWKKVAKATGYYIYCLDAKTKQFVKIGQTDNTTYTVKKLKNKTSFTFKVCAYRTRKSQTYIGSFSKNVTAVPMVKKPARPKPYLSSCTSQSATLTWKTIDGATGYQILQKSSTTGKFIAIGKIKGTSVTISNLESDVTHVFKVRAYRKVKGVTRYSKYSSGVKANPMSVAKEVKSIQTMYYKATINETVNAPIIVKNMTTSQTVQLKAGTTVTVTSRSLTDCIVQISGKKALVNASNLTYVSCVYNSRMDYSDAAKENFVNSKGYTSPTNYLIWVSLYRQKVYLFRGSRKNWKLFQTYPCSTGKAKDATPAGQFYLYAKSPKFVFDEYSYADYACYFNGSALHSWLKYTANGQSVPDGTLGHPASHGCVRLKTEDIFFIYENIPMYTRIVMF